MEKLIHQYLDENYFPYKQENDYYRLYKNDYELETLYEIRAYELVKNLTDIYLIEIEEIKLFIYTWSIKYFPDIDLDKYWVLDEYVPILGQTMLGAIDCSLSQNTLPWVAIAGVSIGLDLVTVQPMTAPKGILQYLDFKYEPKKKTFKEKVNEVLGNIKIFIRKIEKDIRKYLHITNYNATFVTQ